MGDFGTELKIVSLVRYIDACDPLDRHRDCPHAAERNGEFTCREECREVLASMLRRSRASAGPDTRTFDARELLLGETGATPHMLWHTSSLLQVIVDAARTPPLFEDGTVNLRRLVNATSALGALGCRGLDPDKVIRHGIAETIKLTLAAWLEILESSDDPRSKSEHAARWRAFLQPDADGGIAGGYIEAVWFGRSARRLNTWLESAPLDDVLRWRPPEEWPAAAPARPAGEEPEFWAWIIDRFTQTYLAEWSPESLKREYRYLKGEWSPGLPTELLDERAISRAEVATALADRASVDGDAIDPATMSSLTGQAIALLEEGQRKAAAALLDGARKLKPSDLTLQQNHAFCILVDEPEKARAAFRKCLAREVTLCNMALAEALLGDVGTASDACELAYTTAAQAEKAYLWVQGEDGWIIEKIGVRRWAVRLGAELERRRGITGGQWAARRASLDFTALPGSCADPSSAGTDGADP